MQWRSFSLLEVIGVSGTDPSPQFTPERRTKVRFAVGEGLWLSSNASVAAIRSFSPLMFMSYEPSDVRYLENDAHEIVEVISLIRWRGLLFPYPEFGGVLVVPQDPEGNLLGWTNRVFFGAGKWIPPEEIAQHEYLRGQNILSYEVSRYIAESLRFMKGFLAPLPGYHQGDVRIPASADVGGNPQPYTTFFAATNGLPGMLYHYFSLEPYLAGKHGLVASVLIPADGTARILVYQHEERGESLMGVSTVPSFVIDSKKSYNWEKSAPVEVRPYVRYVGGERRFLWFTTVVTKKDFRAKVVKAGDAEKPLVDKSRSTPEYVTSGIPEVALVDAGTQEVFWVDPRSPAAWIERLPRK